MNHTARATWWEWENSETLEQLSAGADESDYRLLTCNHEEFDTRVMLPAANAVSHGYERLLIIANDTDIIVPGISLFSDIGAHKLWVSLGIGNKLRNISNHDICSTIYSSKARALPASHALTWHECTSVFLETAKKSAYAKWSTIPYLRTTLCHLMDKPETTSSDDIAVTESFVISLYSVYCTLTDEFDHCRGNTWTICEFHESTCNCFGDIWWTDNPIYFSSIDTYMKFAFETRRFNHRSSDSLR